jgi:hypothetical protein
MYVKRYKREGTRQERRSRPSYEQAMSSTTSITSTHLPSGQRPAKLVFPEVAADWKDQSLPAILAQMQHRQSFWCFGAQEPPSPWPLTGFMMVGIHATHSDGAFWSRPASLHLSTVLAPACMSHCMTASVLE